MRNYAIAAAIGSLSISQPLLAQETVEEPPKVTIEIVEAEEDEDGGFMGLGDDADNPLAMAIFGGLIAAMFQADPLSDEAEARLPQAQTVAGALVPEGVYGRMMSDMMDTFTSPIFSMAQLGGGMSAEDLALYTGLSGEQVDALSVEERCELTAIFDPVHEERATAGMAQITSVVGEVFDIVEPGMREGLSKAYASRFTESELAELNAFFATPTGAKYAAQSLPVQADKQVIVGMMQSVPALIERMPEIVEALENDDDGLPEPRGYDDLTPAEQRRASELLGVDQVSLRTSMREAAEMKALAEEIVEAAAADTEASLEAMEESDEEKESFEDAMEDVGAE